MERVAGIEPAPRGRKHRILPLNYTRTFFHVACTTRILIIPHQNTIFKNNLRKKLLKE